MLIPKPIIEICMIKSHHQQNPPSRPAPQIGENLSNPAVPPSNQIPVNN